MFVTAPAASYYIVCFLLCPRIKIRCTFSASTINEMRSQPCLRSGLSQETSLSKERAPCNRRAWPSQPFREVGPPKRTLSYSKLRSFGWSRPWMRSYSSQSGSLPSDLLGRRPGTITSLPTKRPFGAGSRLFVFSLAFEESKHSHFI